MEKNINFEAEDEMLLQPDEINIKINRISKFTIVPNNSSPTLIKDAPYFNSPLKINRTRCFRGYDSNQDQFIKMIVTNIVDEIVLFEDGRRANDEFPRRCIPGKKNQYHDLKIREGKILKNEMNENAGRFGW